MPAPLEGIRIIEMAGIGPCPFAAMMLADHGAEVIRIDRVGQDEASRENAARDVLLRSRKTVFVDLKCESGRQVVRDLVRSADGLIEGFRPGVMERLGLGPDVLFEDNPLLVYGRMTGWGQSGPLSTAAGHDINYIAVSGALHTFGRAGEKPTPPLNMVGDFGGGSMMLLFGILSALLHVRGGGQGQVVDCAMTDGSATLMSLIWGLRARNRWTGSRGTNLLDTGAHFYDTYETSDARWVAIGPVEPKFYRLLLEKMGLSEQPGFEHQMDQAAWPALKGKMAAAFLSKTRDEWCELLEGTDACFSPVLDFDEAISHPHNRARGTFAEIGGVMQPMPTPRYSTLETIVPKMADGMSATEEILLSMGYNIEKIEAFKDAGALL